MRQRRRPLEAPGIRTTLRVLLATGVEQPYGRIMGLTLVVLAGRLGVSVATASRVMNQHPGVREPARSRVLAVVAALGYRTNGLARGHRRIAHLGGPTELTSSADRHDGYDEALRAAGIEPDPAWYVPGPFSFESGYERMLRWIEAGFAGTALFAADDLIAVGALQACQDRGWAIPQRLAIVGFDDVLLARLVRPRLTTVLQPAYQAGTLAWRLLAERLADPAAHPADVILEPRLVVRETT